MKSNLVNPQQLQERTMLEVCPPETKQNNSTPKENYFRISKPQIVGEKKTVFYHSKCYDDLALIPKKTKYRLSAYRGKFIFLER